MEKIKLTRPRILPGDILAVQGQSWMSRQILRTTGGPCSHVGLFCSDGKNPLIIEALSRVVIHPLDEALADTKKAWVLHALNLDMRQRLNIVQHARAMHNKRYGYLRFFLQFADCLTRSHFFSTYCTIPGQPICSVVVAHAYSQEGLYFGHTFQSVSPAEIFTYAKNNPDKYKMWEIQ